MFRTFIANALINAGRALGRSDGRELKVELSDHSIETSMSDPNNEDHAWDPDLYRYGNVFLAGYANPIKPRVRRHEELEDTDVVEINESSSAAAQDETDGSDEDDDGHTSIISSSRYRDYMRQDLISQLLNPREQWRLIVFAIIGLGILQFTSMIVTLWATGSF